MTGKVARTLVKREATGGGTCSSALRQEDKIAAAALAAAEAEAAADWTPKRDHKLGPRPVQRVGRLFDMCLDLLVEYIEDVETLYGLPSAIKVPFPHFCGQQSEGYISCARSAVLSGSS